MKKYKIGVYGSAIDEGEEIIKKAQELGGELALKKVITIIGANSGLPHETAKRATEKGGELWCYPPCTDTQELKKMYPEVSQSMYSKIFYIPKLFEFKDNIMVQRKYRNVISTANCDAGIIISGRWGSLNEFTNLIDYGKIIGVLTGTGGIADELPDLMKKIKKEGSGKVLFSSSPKELVEKIIYELPGKVR